MRVDPEGTCAAPPGVGLRFLVVVSAAIVLTLGATLALLAGVGAASRQVPPRTEVVLVDDAGQLLEVWDSAGVHGVVLVDATRDFGYAPVDERAILREPGWPVRVTDLPSAWRRSVDRPNHVWVAAKTGIARSVTYLLPATELQERVRTGREQGFPGIAPDGGSITANDEGYLRTIDDSLNWAPATAVLNVDASYFVRGTAEELTSQLGESVAEFRLITVNRAVDATGVPPSARVSAEKMAAILRQQASR